MANLPVSLFDNTISLLSRSLDLRARKHEMILENVANADTPNYKPFEMNVKEALRRETQDAPPLQLERTDPRDLPGRPMTDDASAGDVSAADDPLLLRGDHNGVDIDAEMSALAKNSLLYKASAQIVGTKFKWLRDAITEGNK
jgi:flagellar basal-body rod protein FlgB